MFSIEFDTDGSAFCDQATGEPDSFMKAAETSRILNEVMIAVRAGLDHGTCIDLNGNRVGTWRYSEERKDEL